jgi:putative copper export protein
MPRLEQVNGRVGRSLLAESAVAMSVLLVAAILVDSKPPERPLPITSTHARTLAP